MRTRLDIQRKVVKESEAPKAARRRKPHLDRERVLRAGIALADREGIAAVTMRKLGQELGVEAMSLYHYVANKDDVVNGMVDLLISDVPVPQPRTDWRDEIRARASSARSLFAPHPWAAHVLASGDGGSSAIWRYMDWAVGVFRRAGFPPALVHSAIHLLGARLLGLNLEPFSEGIGPADAKVLQQRLSEGVYPAIAEAIKGMRHDDEREFAFGLDVVLDGLERARRERRARHTLS